MIKSIKQIIEEKARKAPPGNIAYEFQDYGVRLATELGDLKHKSFYIKLAKGSSRNALEAAKEYALSYHRPRSKAKIFMWFLKEHQSAQKNFDNSWPSK